MGNFYLIHESVNNIKYYDFNESAYINVDQGQQIYSGNIESIPTKNKAKFPQHFFPEVSRRNNIFNVNSFFLYEKFSGNFEYYHADRIQLPMFDMYITQKVQEKKILVTYMFIRILLQKEYIFSSITSDFFARLV